MHIFKGIMHHRAKELSKSSKKFFIGTLEVGIRYILTFSFIMLGIARWIIIISKIHNLFLVITTAMILFYYP